MSIEEFEALLNKHDWWFEHSDDHRYWEKGHRERCIIREVANMQQGEFKRMYFERLMRNGQA